MSLERLLRVSRLLSEAEELARPVRTGQGIRDALHLAQLAIARQLARLQPATAASPVDVPPNAPLADRVLAKLRAHLRSAGKGGQSRIAAASGLSGSTISKILRGGRVGEPHLRRLETALDQAHQGERP